MGAFTLSQQVNLTRPQGGEFGTLAPCFPKYLGLLGKSFVIFPSNLFPQVAGLLDDKIQKGPKPRTTGAYKPYIKLLTGPLKKQHGGKVSLSGLLHMPRHFRWESKGWWPKSDHAPWAIRICHIFISSVQTSQYISLMSSFVWFGWAQEDLNY